MKHLVNHHDDDGADKLTSGQWSYHYNISNRYTVKALHFAKKTPTIHQVTTILATSKMSFPGYNHLLTTGTDDPTLIIACQRVKSQQYQWLASGYDLAIGPF